MLAGVEFRNDRPVPVFVRQAFANWSIFSALGRAGYVIDATSIMPTPWFEDWFVADEAAVNAGSARFSIRKPFVSRHEYREFTARQLLELSLSRHAPHAMKVALSENPTWFDRVFFLNSARDEASVRQHEAANSAAFLRQFVDRMSLGRNQRAYKLLHVGVPHRPIVLDEDCGFIDQTRFSAPSYLRQSRCAINLVTAFFDRLRDLGIYDSSLIVVSSDHGTALTPRGLFGRSESLPMSQGVTTPRLSAIIGSSRPLMLIKPPGGVGLLEVSEAPTVHTDLPVTMLAVLGVSEGPAAESMFERDPSVNRPRAYGMYDLDQRFPDGYLDRLDVIAVASRSVDASGWSWRRSVLSPNLTLTAAGVEMGSSRAEQHLGPGWAVRRPGRDEDAAAVWGISERAVVYASLPHGRIELVARVSAPVDDGVESIKVSVDWSLVERWETLEREGYQDYSAVIPADPTRPAVSIITFRFATPGVDDFEVMFERLSFREE